MINLSGALAIDSFKGRADDLVKLFQMAETSAAQTGKRYGIVIDFSQNGYLLSEITTSIAMEDITDEEIIDMGWFSDRFQVSYVMFDDGQMTNNTAAMFRVGKTGWQYGGKIVVADENGKLYSIIVNRLSRKTDIVEGDAIIPTPRTEDEMGF
jgi:hypothetical protein